ncbi:MAG: UDP-N-acetylmuramoyl-L-alanine--D-glutamate ligase [Pseudohongiellaceae bacterium]
MNTPVIVGLGETGMSCARYFLSRGETFKVVDTRTAPPALAQLTQLAPEAEVELGEFSPATLSTARQLIVSPGVSVNTVAIQQAIAAGVPITGDIGIFAREAKAPIVAVTGSNGKSTVVALLAHILHKAGRNIGLGGNLDGTNFKPALDLLHEEHHDMYVLELSSFQLETTEQLDAEVATVLNLSEDHKDRYPNPAQYLRAKQQIFNGCKQVVINRDDPSSQPPHPLDVPVWEFGLSHPATNSLGLLEEDGNKYLAQQSEKIIAVSELNIFGHHNIANALAAAALALALDVNMEAIRNGLKAFTGLPHRCQQVATINGVTFYNDSKATNVGATRAAIEGLGEHITGHIILIAGGLGKDANFHPLQAMMKRRGKAAILIGKDAKALATALDANTPTHFANDMQTAVQIALEQATPGDAVLLSPACASFDMFDNFQQRGEAFIQAVEQLQ